MADLIIAKSKVLRSKQEKVSSYFSPTRSVTVKGVTLNGHSGIDIIPEDDIVAFADGKVEYVKNTVPGIDTSSANAYGNNIIISHNNKYKSRYCHLAYNSIRVKVGDNIKKGTVIGRMGTTGYSTGVHLHFEILENNVRVDPLPFLLGKKVIQKANVVPKPQKASAVSNVKTNAVSGRKYIVKAGDSFWRIADMELGDGSRYTEIMRLNKMTEKSIIKPGDVLILPKK